MDQTHPLITNDAIVLGILMTILALVFKTSHSNNAILKKFYTFVPALLLCYFLPSLLVTANIISGHESKLYFVASRYLLPTSLVLMCLSIDLREVIRLGPKALIMFLTGTIGIVLGGPIALIIMTYLSPETVIFNDHSIWRGLTTIAGSWIGGGANQTAMREVFQVPGDLFSATVAVDIIVANVWMAVILYMAGESDVFDKKLKADNSGIKRLQKKMEDYHSQIAKIPSLTDIMMVLGVGFAVTGVGHLIGDAMGPWIGENFPKMKGLSLHSPFLWLVVIATAGGLILSFTRARELEGAGASKIGSAFLYVLVATIGMEMDLKAIFQNPGLFVLGAIWISFHAILLLIVARLIKAPLFFLAVGSQANVGGAASAPVVASAFHPTLAPVGVLLATLGYFIGTFGALICGYLMQWIAG